MTKFPTFLHENMPYSHDFGYGLCSCKTRSKMSQSSFMAAVLWYEVHHTLAPYDMGVFTIAFSQALCNSHLAQAHFALPVLSESNP